MFYWFEIGDINMSMFLVIYEHKNDEAWQEGLAPHIHWLLEKLKQGSLKASGPLVGSGVKSAALIITADNQASAHALLADDPYMLNGAVTGLTITQWDPIFGAFNAESSRPGQIPT